MNLQSYSYGQWNIWQNMVRNKDENTMLQKLLKYRGESSFYAWRWWMGMMFNVGIHIWIGLQFLQVKMMESDE